MWRIKFVLLASSRDFVLLVLVLYVYMLWTSNLDDYCEGTFIEHCTAASIC